MGKIAVIVETAGKKAAFSLVAVQGIVGCERAEKDCFAPSEKEETWNMGTKSNKIRAVQAELTHCSFCSVGFTSVSDGKMRSGWSVIVAEECGEAGRGGRSWVHNHLRRPI